MKFIKTNATGDVVYEMYVYETLTDEEKAMIGEGILVDEIPEPPDFSKQYRKKYIPEQGFLFEEILPDRITELETKIARLKLLDMDCSAEQAELKQLLGY